MFLYRIDKELVKYSYKKNISIKYYKDIINFLRNKEKVMIYRALKYKPNSWSNYKKSIDFF